MTSHTSNGGIHLRSSGGTRATGSTWARLRHGGGMIGCVTSAVVTTCLSQRGDCKKAFFSLGSLLSAVVFLSGCESGGRLYDGPPRTLKDVAIIVTQENCRVSIVTHVTSGERAATDSNHHGNRKVRPWTIPHVLEILPSECVLLVGYSADIGVSHVYTPRPLLLTIDAKPGYVYCIYPILGNGAFRPGLAKYAYDGGLEAMGDLGQDSRYARPWDTRARVGRLNYGRKMRERLDRYLQGERPVLKGPEWMRGPSVRKSPTPGSPT